MGKSSFVDKKKATSYRLIHRPTQDSDSVPEVHWVETSRNVGIGRPDVQSVATAVLEAAKQGSEFHPLAWLRQEQDDISEERRQEIIKLGFPDDGYDYLKHLRQVGRPQASAVGATQGSASGDRQAEASVVPQDREETSGPSVFLPAEHVEEPPEDYKTYDASRLLVHQTADDDNEAALIAGGVTAFSRELHTVRRKHQLEVDEMERLMRQLEDVEGSDVNGDLENDFVLAATEMGCEAEAHKGTEHGLLSTSVAEEVDDEDYAGSDVSSSDDFHPEATPSEHKSFASTYWRPERTDRKGALSIIDERFERLALEYDSDEIGELDELEDDPSAQGPASTDQFSGIMDEFLAVHATQDHAHEGGQLYHTAAVASRAIETREDAALAAAALAKAKEQLRVLEAQEEAEPSREGEESYEQAEEAPRDIWDCESILSTRSTLYNHPTRIDSCGRRRQRQDPHAIRLSRKTGLPVGPKACTEEEDDVDIDEQASLSGASLAPLPRKKDETPEEKKARKEAVKEAKRVARVQKKELKGMFKEEALRQHRRLATPAPTTHSLA